MKVPKKEEDNREQQRKLMKTCPGHISEWSLNYTYFLQIVIHLSFENATR